jgi:hypothetical protein
MFKINLMTERIIAVTQVLEKWSSESLLVHGTEAAEINNFNFFFHSSHFVYFLWFKFIWMVLHFPLFTILKLFLTHLFVFFTFQIFANLAKYSFASCLPVIQRYSFKDNSFF